MKSFAPGLAKGAFFWDYSRMRTHGREARCVLLSDIPIPEWTEYYSGHSAPEGGMNRIILKTVYSEERNRSKKCSFRKLHEPAILFAPRPTLPTNGTVFGLLILLLDNIPSNPLFSVRVFSFWKSPKRMPPKINRKWLLVLINLRLKSNLCPKFPVCGYLYPLLYFRFWELLPRLDRLN